MIFYSIFILFVFIAGSQVEGLGCDIKSGGLNFDYKWSLIYKPSITSLKEGYFFHGHADFTGWNYDEKDIFEEGSILNRILDEVYQDHAQEKKISFIQYNNKNPEKDQVSTASDSTSSNQQQSTRKKNPLKGSLIWDKNSTIWTIYTFKTYLDEPSGKYRFSKTKANVNKSNMFLCIQIDKKYLPLIWNYLKKSNVNIYNRFIADENGDRKLKEDEKKLSKSRNVFSSGKNMFKIISRGKNKDDFWQKVTKKHLNNFTVGSYLSSRFSKRKCNEFLNVNEIEIKHDTTGPITWRSNTENPRYFIGCKDDRYFFCIDDTKGYAMIPKNGFALCIYDLNLYETFMASMKN